MKIVLTLLVRDEEDIIGQNIDYHLNHGVDFVVVTDNLSVDGTRDILEEFRRLGVLHYIHEPEDNYAQGKWVTRMARLSLTEFQADWVINSDADEFWLAERKKDLKEVLRDVASSVPGLRVRRHNFVPRLRTRQVGFLEAMIYREVCSVNGSGEPLPPKVCHRAMPNVAVAQGNHAVYMGGFELDVPDTDELCILHFPMRTLEQFSRKIEKGGGAYTRSSLPVQVGNVWRELYQVFRKDGLGRFFDEQIFDDQQLHYALTMGTVVEDQRLLQCFRESGLSIEPGMSHRRIEDR